MLFKNDCDLFALLTNKREMFFESQRIIVAIILYCFRPHYCWYHWYCFCDQFGELIKLLANSLGMSSEHIRTDRDSYIFINRTNIDRSNLANLQKIPGLIKASVYDLASVTHAYSKVNFQLR